MSDNEILDIFERAGQVHGHRCPSLYYGVKGIVQAVELANRQHVPLERFLLEGKSKCIRDGAKVALAGISDRKLELVGGGCAVTIGNRQNNIRLEVRREVRQMIGKLNESLPLEEYQRQGVLKLQSLAVEEFFNTGKLTPEEFDHLAAQVENTI